MKGLSKGGNAYALKNGYVDAQKENSAEKIFVKFLPKPRTDGKKVSFYKWRGYQEKVMFMYWKMAIPMGSKENSAEKFVKIIPETVYWGEKSVLL